VAGTISNILGMLNQEAYEVELRLDRRGRVLAVVERWVEGGRVKEKKRRVKKLPW